MSNTIVGEIAQEPRPVGFLTLMRNQNYALLWWGQLVSELGNRFHWIAVSLWIFSLTHSATAVSLAISSMFFGNLLIGLWAGVLVDRLNRKAILIASDLARVGLVALIPTLIKVSIWLAYVDLIAISMATAFFRPAMFAIIPQVVSRRNVMPANSFFTAMDTGTEIVGPVIAGLLAFTYGYSPLLYIDAATYAVSAICVFGMSIPHIIPAIASDLRLRGIWSGVVDGLRYIRRDKLQWGLFVLIFPAYLVGSGLNSLQTPLAKGVVGISDAAFGTFNSVWGAGFVVGSLLLGWYGARVRKSLVILGGYLLAFIFTGLMGLSTSFQVLLLTGFAVGFANTLYYVGLGTVIMEYTPQYVIGRVISTRQVALSSVRVISPLIFGAFADIVGVRQAIFSMSVVGLVGTGVAVALYPVIGRFDERKGGDSEHTFGIWRLMSGPVHPSFDEAQQRKLNVITIGVAMVAWVALFYQVPQAAGWLLPAILVLATLGSFARSKGWIS